MTIVNALKQLYEALGGEHDDIVNVMTVTEALDKIQQLYDGEEISSDAAEAIQNITAVAGNITPGPGPEPEPFFNKLKVYVRTNDLDDSHAIKIIWNRDNDEIDITDFNRLDMNQLKIVEPIKKLTVPDLVSIGDGYQLCFIPGGSDFKLFIGETEANISDIFVPVQTPSGPIPFDPTNGHVCTLKANYSPYSGKTIELIQSDYDPELNAIELEIE